MNAPTILSLVQGSDEWARHRATALNASDAPAMMGVSKYRSRAELIRERATGIVPDVDPATQRLFDRGHAAEAAARQYAENHIGEELYPVTLTRDVDGLPLSASLDGQTMDGSTIWEHKLWSASLAAHVLAGELEPHYYWQLEHQLLVSGAERVIFTTSDGTAENSESMEYRAVPGRAEALIAGWKQFQADVAEYQPEPAASPAPVAAPVEGFGALSLRVEGRVLASNLDAFRSAADGFLARLPKASELETDQDFADAEAAVKACTEAEARIKAAIDAALAQMSDVDAVMRAAGTVSETIRTARLALDKAVKAEKENRRAMTVAHYVKRVGEHIAEINKTLGEFAICVSPSLSHDIAAAAKGKRTIMGIVDACDQAAADAKIAASQKAETIRQNIAVLNEYAYHLHLFADRVTLAHTKQPEDLRLLVAARIVEHEQREAERIEAERERIRAEEQAKAELAAQNFEGITSEAPIQCHNPDPGEPGYREPIQAGVAQPVEHLPSKQNVAGSTPAARSTVKLGQINEAIGPLSITAEGLASLGFLPVGTERAAKLYDASQFPAMRAAIIELLESADLPQQVAA